jgi:HEAT repeat protein
MLILKRFLIIAAVLIVLPVMVTAQTQAGASPNGREMSVEQSYLQESVELMIIREQSRTDSRDMKMVALEYIGDAIDRGNKSDEIRVALEFLSLEGVVNVARENGRVVNNFPDVRKSAATYLGKLGTAEAKDTLLKMVNGDNEPMVITEAIRSLGTIGMNDADEVTKTISWTVNRFHGLNPDNFMALSALDTFAKIAAANGGIKDRSAVETIIRIAEGPYVRPVQDRAKELLRELREYDRL